jgi:hypothetical protein
VDFSRVNTDSHSSDSHWRLFKVILFYTDDRLQGPQILSTIRFDPMKPNPKSGVAQMEWNLTGSLLMVRFGEYLDQEK